VTAAAQELHPDDGEVVDMLEVVSDAVFGVLGVAPTDHQVPRGAHANLIRDNSGEDKVSFGPANLDLVKSTSPVRFSKTTNTHRGEKKGKKKEKGG
jgi:hypothetical protein